MDRLEVMQLFVQVADTRSFSKAARSAGVGQPAVSKQIAALESRLGVQLLQRSSHGLRLTTAGRRFYEAASRLLADFEEMESQVGREHVAPSGIVRVATSAALGRMHIVPRLPEFFEQYPGVSLDFRISERHISLIEDGIDVAIRIGNLSDSTLVARRIGSMQPKTVASPAYLERRGRPTKPEDLANHDCVTFIFQDAPRPWNFKGPEGPFSIEPRGAFRCNDAEHLRAAALAGLGIAHNPGWLFADDLASGALVPLLRKHAPDPFPIHAVSTASRTPSRVRVFIDFVARLFSENSELAIR
jgi:LysR family transcriptional regulator for bpeEF and oprC